MSDKKFEPPLDLHVGIPVDRGFNYGVHSTTNHAATRLIFRVGAEHSQTIKEAAGILNMSVSMFCRESAINTAKKIKELRDAHLQSLRSG